MRSCSGFGGRQVSSSSSGVFGLVQMQGVQRQVAPSVPVGGGAMQLAPARLQQRAIDAIAHQRVNEGKAAAVLLQELLIDEMCRLVVGIVKKMSQHRQRYPLTQDRGGLQCALLCRREQVGAAQNEALH